MQFLEILKNCQGQTVIINNSDERELVEICDDFIVLKGGNPQMRITEFLPVSMIVKVIRADYITGMSSLSIDTLSSAGEQRRSGAGH